MSRRLKTSYIIYPPNYDPYSVDGTKRYKTCKFYHRAIRIAVGMGSGAEIYKDCKRRYRSSYDEDGFLPGFTMSYMVFWRSVR